MQEVIQIAAVLFKVDFLQHEMTSCHSSSVPPRVINSGRSHVAVPCLAKQSCATA